MSRSTIMQSQIRAGSPDTMKQNPVLTEFYQKLMDLFLEKKYYQPFQISPLKRPLRLSHGEPAVQFCQEQDFQQCFKMMKKLLSLEEDAEGESKHVDLPERLKKIENFQAHRKSRAIIYRKPLRFGLLLNDSNHLSEVSISGSDLEDELGWILNQFCNHFKVNVLKLESNRFFESQTVCGRFCEQLVGATLVQLSLDRTKLHGCDLAALFRIQLVQLSMRFCSIEDEDVLSFCQPLAKNETLKVLNLNFNRIKDMGCKCLAESLRLNRSLNCLSLMHNSVGNAGCRYLLSILKTFRLSREEVVELRKTKLDQYLATLDENGRPLPRPTDNESKVQFSEDVEPLEVNKSSAKSRATMNMSRSKAYVAPIKPKVTVEAPRRDFYSCEPHFPLVQTNSYGSPMSGQGSQIAGTATTSGGRSARTGRPGGMSCKLLDGAVYSDGNFHLTHLYLSHNKLTPSIVPEILNLLEYQQIQQTHGSPPGIGLVAITIHNHLISHDMTSLKQMIGVGSDVATNQKKEEGM
ncbi:hypothetical protein M8J76_002989 [Diaphorina citri]|nr:hypothetical protein M8J76_002989 [Diaphorina citri]